MKKGLKKLALDLWKFLKRPIINLVKRLILEAFPSEEPPIYLPKEIISTGLQVGIGAETQFFKRLKDHLEADNPHNVGILSGTIAMWSGLRIDIPLGWVFCDGQNNTPDLRDRFIMSVTGKEEAGLIGGANSKTLLSGNIPSHRHAIGGSSGSQSANHSHTLAHTHYFDRSYTSTNGGNIVWQKGASGAPSYRQTTSGASVASSGSNSVGHSHAMPSNSGYYGSGSAFDNKPFYFKLAFIMKT